MSVDVGHRKLDTGIRPGACLLNNTNYEDDPVVLLVEGDLVLVLCNDDEQRVLPMEEVIHNFTVMNWITKADLEREITITKKLTSY